jgi:hypothetical protein
MKGMAKRFNKPQCPAHFDESELKTNLGSGNFIFVGSSIDLFAYNDIPEEWIQKTINHCQKFDNRYLFQSKNPSRILPYIIAYLIEDKSVVCTTIETNRHYPKVMNKCPLVIYRAEDMRIIRKFVDTYVTIEPIMDFDLPEMIRLIELCSPKQVNIGADTGHNSLPEPSKEKVLALTDQLKSFTKVIHKPNLNRLLK